MSIRRLFGLGPITTLLVSLSAAAPSSAAAAPLVLDLGGGVTMELLPIKHGTFTEGSPPEEAGRTETETARRVTLTRDFYIGKHPVTVGQFKRFAAAFQFRTEAEIGTSGGYGYDGMAIVQRKEFNWKHPGFTQTDEHPVTIITYADALAFTVWLSRKTHYQLTLPTEAEWEYACRAGTTTRFHSGEVDDDLKKIGWYKGNAVGGTHPVGAKQPNAFGLFDMSGNVFEWCRDWSVPRTAAAATDPLATTPESKENTRRVLRGGSWFRDPKHGRSAARYQSSPGTRSAEIGFRLVAAADDKGAPLQSAAPVTTPGAPSLVPSTPKGNAAIPNHADQALPDDAGGLSMGTMVMIAIAVVALVGVLMLSAKLRSGSSGQSWNAGSSENIQQGTNYFTPAEDGFWFDRLDISPNTLLQMTYLLNGVLHNQRVTTERGPRQFVYTGGPPVDIRIVDGNASTDDLSLADDPYRSDDRNRFGVFTSDPTPPSSSSSDFRGYPAAY